MRYLQSTPFPAQMGDKNAQKNFRDNYEATFGKKVVKKPKKREAISNEAVAAR
jgi:hypothetical protein